jgi:hypothetical protein
MFNPADVSAQLDSRAPCRCRGMQRGTIPGSKSPQCRGRCQKAIGLKATALAAGHRPCFLCRRDAARTFQARWAAGNGCPLPTAPQIDIVLHRERLWHGNKRIHPLTGKIADLPDGAMVALGDQAFVISEGHPLLWTVGGYLPIDATLH